MKYFQKIIFSSLPILTAVIGARFSLAAASTQGELYNQMNKAGGTGWGYTATSIDLPVLIRSVISAFLGLLGIIFLVLIIYAGYNWMTAQGDEDKVTKAKDTLTRAVIGLAIIAAAYSITYFVFSNLPGGGGGGSTDEF